MAGDRKPGGPLVGIAWMLAGMIVIPLMDGTAKVLVQSYPALEVVWSRYAFHLLFLLPVVIGRHGRAGLRPARLGLHLARAGLMAASTLFFVNAVRTLPLADALAIVFISPMIVALLSPWLLGEPLDGIRALAAAAGFAGVCLVIRPGFTAFDWGSPLALGSGAAYALYLIATRRLAGGAPPEVTLFFTALAGGVGLIPLLPTIWVAPAPVDLARMAFMGAISAGGHFLIIKAFDNAPAALLAPFVYLQIATAVVFGFVVFGDLPDPVTWAGIAVIVGSGLAVSLAARRPRGA